MLVHTGLLPARAEYLERISPWLDDLLLGQPTDRTHPQRAWVQWTLLRRARFRLAKRPFTEGAAHGMRSSILAALAFPTWIDGTGKTSPRPPSLSPDPPTDFL